MGTAPQYDVSKKSGNSGGFWGNLLSGNWLGAAWDIGSGIYDRINENKWANANWEAQKEQQKYDRELQQTIFDREDNAVSRRVEDMKNAGINPVMAAGAAAQAGTPIKTETPERAQNVKGFPHILEILQTREQIGKSKAERKLIDAQADAVRDEIKMRKSRFHLDEEKFTFDRERFENAKNEFRQTMADQTRRTGLEEQRINLALDQFDRATYEFDRLQELRLKADWRSEEYHRTREEFLETTMQLQRTLDDIRQYYLKTQKTIPPAVRAIIDEWSTIIHGMGDAARAATTAGSLF